MKKVSFILIILSSSILFGQSNDWLSIGIVRTDGVIIPTFRFEMNKWWNITNEMDEFRFHESRLREWYFVPFSNDPYYLNVGSLVHYDPDSDISSAYGYLTDYLRSDLTRNVFPIKKVGVGVSKEYPISLMRSISNSTELFQDVFRLVSSKHIEVDTNFMKLELWDEILGQEHIVKFDSINLKGTMVDNYGIYYYEAQNLYQKGGCFYIFSSGWIIKTNNTYKIIEDFIGSDDCDFKLLSSIPVTPLFAMKISDEFYVHLIHGSWEGEDYELWKIDENNLNKLPWINDKEY